MPSKKDKMQEDFTARVEAVVPEQEKLARVHLSHCSILLVLFLLICVCAPFFVLIHLAFAKSLSICFSQENWPKQSRIS